MDIREHLYRLVDELPEGEIQAAQRYLEYLRGLNDPVVRTLLDAPYDDEPETEEERAAVSEAREDLKSNHIVSPDTVWNEIS